MRSKIIMVFVALLLPLAAQAQWRVGVSGGATYNTFSMDRQYMDDFRIDGRWGATAGVSCQYDFTDWLAVRADLNWTQKNFRKHRILHNQIDFKYRNDYLQLPVTAVFSFGGGTLRGFCKLGVYGGYWLASHREGTDYNNFADYTFDLSEQLKFNPEVDQRWDFGPVGGLGVQYRISARWAVQAEACYYYSVVSTTRQYMRVSDYRYNSTAAIQLGVQYIF